MKQKTTGRFRLNFDCLRSSDIKSHDLPEQVFPIYVHTHTHSPTHTQTPTHTYTQIHKYIYTIF